MMINVLAPEYNVPLTTLNPSTPSNVFKPYAAIRNNQMAAHGTYSSEMEKGGLGTKGHSSRFAMPADNLAIRFWHLVNLETDMP